MIINFFLLFMCFSEFLYFSFCATVHSKLHSTLTQATSTQTSTTSQKITTTSESPSTVNQHISGLPQFVPTVIGASKTYVCGSEKCLKISEYAIASNFSYNCFEDYLPISFEVPDNESNKYLSFGFLPEDGTQIQKKQINRNSCKIIKRYYVNERQLLIVIGETIEYVEKLMAVQTIQKQLIKNSFFYQYFLYKLGIYDEFNDSIQFLDATKDVVFFGVIIKLLFVLYFNLKRIWCCIEYILDESSRSQRTTSIQKIKKN